MPETFGDFIRRVRLNSNSTLRKFCISNQTNPVIWSKLEKNCLKNKPSIEETEKIASISKMTDEEKYQLFQLRDSTTFGALPNNNLPFFRPKGDPEEIQKKCEAMARLCEESNKAYDGNIFVENNNGQINLKKIHNI